MRRRRQANSFLARSKHSIIAFIITIGSEAGGGPRGDGRTGQGKWPEGLQGVQVVTKGGAC